MLMDNKQIYHVPQTYDERTRLRSLIDEFVSGQRLGPPLSMNDLSNLSDRLIHDEGLDPEVKGWIMVEINNCVWRETVAAIPHDKRILLLPKCLSNSAKCQADVDEFGLLCHRCNHCSIPNLQDKADELGMMSLVAEGFTSVIGLIENRVVDTVIGVSCLDSLEKAFPLLINHAVPGLAIPLNKTGCKDTTVDYAYVEEMIGMRSEKEVYLLDYEYLKSTLDAWFSMENLTNLLSPADDLTSRVAREWIGGEGKRWRPYLLAATYMALNGQKEIPKEVEWAAIAVECFHKASLVHDDIQDNDSTRYGKQTVHALYGEAIAINVGDLLLGYGYLLLARCGNMALIEVAAKAHADLCRGQGMELEWTATQGALTADFVLEVFRLKTVPAFDVSLAMGVLCAGGDQSLIDNLHDYAEALGIAYQLLDDLEDDGIATSIDHPRELAKQYHRQALETLHRIPNTELRRLLFRVTQRILK
ncbi:MULTISPECIES: polyprenyl synthetase family protein [unclassified Parabacteroides]|uniref:polyprenyl synthetase family protein n=1 Tax=unclassified Parabacteroides TaxID=2649774 RepID=UPI002475886F|nr:MULTISPECIES: polyprenyl synthetase family protein [unclassified Parabacteroides]